MEGDFRTPAMLSKGEAESRTLKMVACGSYFAVVLSESGELFGRGHVSCV
jgi:alpha-tubulin suppressor-like RCC1 family protein